MSERYLEDVVEETGITERNVKYWSQKFDLPIAKDGRRNVYPDRTVKLLELVRILTGSELFTRRFVQLQVDRAIGNEDDDVDYLERYRSIREEARTILKSIDTARGSELLPNIDSSTKATNKRASKKRSGGSNKQELDEDLL